MKSVRKKEISSSIARVYVRGDIKRSRITPKFIQLDDCVSWVGI